jgi:hypothetical protein
MRVIHSVNFDHQRAVEHASHLEEQGRHPRIHDRIVQAEKIARLAYVVVCDEVSETNNAGGEHEREEASFSD